MKILLTNDDGYFADGLNYLASVLRVDHQVQIVAPDQECSNCAHQVTAGRALIIQQLQEDLWTVNGWPADCIRVALKHLKLDIDLVIAGINHGGNLGVDIIMSGTCAAARESAFHGIPAIALSQVRKASVPVDWKVTADRAMQVVEHLLPRTSSSGFWNVNLPAVSPLDVPKALLECSPDPSPLIVQYQHMETEGLYFKSDYHSRPRVGGMDVEHCFAGHPTCSFVPIF